jgi:hypothetical protein
MFRKFVLQLKRFLLGRMREATPFHAVFVESRSEARSVAIDNHVIAIVSVGSHAKWAMLQCPCRCGRTLELNLMASHSPCWETTLSRNHQLTISPSVDSTTCGAHFWIRGGQLKWAE